MKIMSKSLRQKVHFLYISIIIGPDRSLFDGLYSKEYKLVRIVSVDAKLNHLDKRRHLYFDFFDFGH